MLAYAARTGTKRNLVALRAAGWRLLLSPSSPSLPAGFPYARDNGAWSAWQQGLPLDIPRFVRMLHRLGPQADWVVVPDIVAGGQHSLRVSLHGLPMVLDHCPRALIAVQDGLGPDDVRSVVGERVGLFVGGSTAWKWHTVNQWGQFGQQHSCYVHVGRVNTAHHIRACGLAGVTSFDGSSASRYSKTLPLLDHAHRQRCLWEKGMPMPPAKYWTNNAILAAIQTFIAREGRMPSRQDFAAAAQLPDRRLVERQFGSVQAALRLATATTPTQEEP